MFKEGSNVKILGVFEVSKIGEEYIELDPFEKEDVEAEELRAGMPITDFSVGQFFKLSGSFKVVRSNEIFTKLKIGSQLVSVPNSKVEVA